MSFFKGILGRSDDIAVRSPLRRDHSHKPTRRNLNTSQSTPKFSRQRHRIVRETTLPGDDTPREATLNEILEHWKEETAPENPEEFDETPQTPPAPVVAERVKTRLLGFDDLRPASTIQSTPTASTTSNKFPVGWLVITDGPGRGESFTLQTGMSQIGRGEDQAVQLDFGDASISRSNHAAIVYDDETHSFLLGHGGKTNIVRLNGHPLITNEILATGDTIKIGETSLQLVIFSTPDFNWAGEVSDVADT